MLRINPKNLKMKPPNKSTQELINIMKQKEKKKEFLKKLETPSELDLKKPKNLLLENPEKMTPKNSETDGKTKKMKCITERKT